MADPKPHIVILPTPGLGHLIPLLEISKRLTTRYYGLLRVTFCMVSTGTSSPEVASLIQSARSTSKYLDFIHLPPPDLAAIPPGASIFSKLFAIMRLSMPALKSAMSSLEVPPTVFMADQFGAETLGVAEELGIPKYMFSPLSAWSFSLVLSMPVLDEEVAGEFPDRKEPIELPGCRPLEVEELPHMMAHRTSDEYEDLVKMGAFSAMADGFLVNTFEGLESSTLASLRHSDLLGKLINKAPVYDVGPIVKRPTGSRDHQLFGWLDRQPVGSVLFVSFGSSGILSPKETNEVALGLEMSQQRFIWVVRPPVVTARDGVFFGAKENDPSSYLPEGFLDRTRELGLVIPQWAPQVEVLGHPSTGGFMSHCGWNSSLEAITNGLPMITWPLHADQMMNARFLVEELRVAVRPNVWPSRAVIGREEIAGMVRKIMADEEGSEIRKRAKELKESAKRALMEGGSSSNALSDFVESICPTLS